MEDVEEEDDEWEESPRNHHAHTKTKSKTQYSKSRTSKSHPIPMAKRPAQPLVIPVTKKSAQAHSKSFRPGPPIVPKMIVNRILEYVGKVQLRKKPQVIEKICRYWSLKREARRGAPLLKRLHLEVCFPCDVSNRATNTCNSLGQHPQPLGLRPSPKRLKSSSFYRCFETILKRCACLRISFANGKKKNCDKYKLSKMWWIDSSFHVARD